MKKLFYILFLTFCFSVSHAQSERAKLEQDKRKVEEEIEYTNKLLDQTRKNRENSLNEVVILNKKIGQREKLIGTISSEIGLVERQMDQAQDSIDLLKKDLQNLKDEYAKMIYYAYKNRNLYDRLEFIFSADDFNQA